MSSKQVSLCVVRIEISSKRKPITDKRDVMKRPNTIPIFRGRRQAKHIKIETLTLMKSNMAEGMDNSVKPLCNSGKVEKVSAKTIIDGKGAHEVLTFVSGNPFVEKTNGIIHLFKEDELTNIERASIRSQTLCMLAIPATMSCTDLLQFLAPVKDTVRHLRIIRDSSPNQYMALITFRSADTVSFFYQNFNGIPFHSFDPEWCCHLVFVSRVESLSENEGGSIAPVSHTELPTCPVCLERMDESVDGILTILCNHAFHGHCLEKWGDSSCPVCRYVQTPEPEDGNSCSECKASESLWICLICGQVGCSRYLQGHAYQHYLDTHHCYSMQIGSNSVWDYVGDNFVHRILQNKADGKLVEGPSQDAKQVEEAKIEALQLEFTYLLTSQLDSQRIYFEDVISNIEQKSDEEMSRLKENSYYLLEENKSLKDNVELLSKEKNTLDKKLQVMSNKLSTAYKQLQEEKELNGAMRKNQVLWQEKYTDLEKMFEQFKSNKNEELRELKDQLRDVMFFLEAEKVVNSSPHKDEMKDGVVEIAKPPGPSKHNRRKKH